MTIFLIVMLLAAWLLIFVNFSGLVGFLMTRVPYQRTYTGEIKEIAKKLGISSKDTFYDLGCGDGRLLFTVNKLTGARCVGYELTWWTYLLARIKSAFYNPSRPPLLQRGGEKNSPSLQKRGLGGVKFKNQNFFKHSWSEANYIYGYLFPHLMGRVEEKFLADCKPGSIAIIRDFPFPNLKPTDIYRMPKKHEIYIYRKLDYN